jgi:hypothetical protein
MTPSLCETCAWMRQIVTPKGSRFLLSATSTNGLFGLPIRHRERRELRADLDRLSLGRYRIPRKMPPSTRIAAPLVAAASGLAR